MGFKISKQEITCFYIQRDQRHIVLKSESAIKPQEISCSSASNEIELVRAEYCAWPYAVLLGLDRQ